MALTKRTITLADFETRLRISDYTENVSPIHVSDNMTAKMFGIPCIGTACTMNERCKRNASIKGSICEHCYAMNMLEYRHSLEDAMIVNYHVLTESVLSEKHLPVFDTTLTDIARLEHYGDLNNVTQLINYSNICDKNPEITFALWTKNPDIVKDCFDNYRAKPANLIIIQSSLFLNKEQKPANEYIDKVFTVYDKEHIPNEDFINCGSRACRKCRRCYTKTAEVEYIHEQLK